MTAYLLDTHTWAWSLVSGALPRRVSERFANADMLQISVISFYEIRQKVRLGKWQQMEPHADNLIDMVEKQGIAAISVSSEIAHIAGAMDWEHRDPFDRIIAATSMFQGCPLISADDAFDALSNRRDWPGRIW